MRSGPEKHAGDRQPILAFRLFSFGDEHYGEAPFMKLCRSLAVENLKRALQPRPAKSRA